MIINNNISSLRSQGALFNNNRALGTDLLRLSTGLRINNASDDAAGLAISETLRTQIRGQEQAKRNALDGISALSIADGAMNEIHNILQRQRELVVQAASDTYTEDERTFINKEIERLKDEIERIIDVTKFNGINLLDSEDDEGWGAGDKKLQVDANGEEVDTIAIDFTALTKSDVAIDSPDSGDDADTWRGHLDELDKAIDAVSTSRAEVGTLINRLEHTVTNLTTSIANQAAAESQLRDLDFAKQSSNFTKNQILTQSATAMLTQANATTQGALQLIR